MSPLFSFVGGIGTPELIIVAAVGLMLFGNRLPSVMRSLGKSVVEFKKGINGIEDEINSAVKTTENVSKEVKES